MEAKRKFEKVKQEAELHEAQKARQRDKEDHERVLRKLKAQREERNKQVVGPDGILRTQNPNNQNSTPSQNPVQSQNPYGTGGKTANLKITGFQEGPLTAKFDASQTLADVDDYCRENRKEVENREMRYQCRFPPLDVGFESFHKTLSERGLAPSAMISVVFQ